MTEKITETSVLAEYEPTLSDEELAYIGRAATEPLNTEIASDDDTSVIRIVDGERLNESLQTYATVYLDRMLVSQEAEKVPDEAASFRYIKATMEERRLARDRVVAESSNPLVERMAIPLLQLGAQGDIDHEIRVATHLALMGAPDTAVQAALIHDAGKALVYDVMSKQGRLTESEKEQSKLHVKGTLALATQAGITDKQVLININEHHDHNARQSANYVGTIEIGPDSDESRREAIMLTLADEFDAISGKRGYKTALSLDETLRIMEGQIEAPEAEWDKFYHLVGRTGKK